MLNTYKLRFTLIVSLLLLASCNVKTTYERFVDKDKDKFARTFIQEVISGDENAQKYVHSDLLDDNAIMFLEQIHNALNGKKLSEISVIGLQNKWEESINLKSGDDVSKSYYAINYEYDYGDVFLFFHLKISRVDGTEKIVGFNAELSKTSYIERVSFSFDNKGVKHYIVLLWLILIPLFLIYAIVMVVKTPIRRKWLWIVLILVFNIGFVFNWTYGVFIWNNIKIVLLGSGVMIGAMKAPWDFSVSVPFGAIIFLFRRRSILKRMREDEELMAMYDNGDELQQNSSETGI